MDQQAQNPEEEHADLQNPDNFEEFFDDLQKHAFGEENLDPLNDSGYFSLEEDDDE